MKEISREAFVAELNHDLAYEFGAAVQYVQHAAMVTGAEYDAISKELIIHSNEEMMHAVSLSNMICDLGGVPGTDVSERHVSTDSKEMLAQDLAGEEGAIARYKERIAQAETLGEYGVRRLLEDILMMEEEHRRDLASTLGK
jgi:bacterioferritin